MKVTPHPSLVLEEELLSYSRSQPDSIIFVIGFDFKRCFLGQIFL